jgi:hypothetical protein
MKRFAFILGVLLVASQAQAITYTLMNDPDSDYNEWRCMSDMWTRVFHTPNDADTDFKDSSTQTGHTSGLWEDVFSSDTSSVTANGGTTSAHADVTPEVMKLSSLTNPGHGSQITWNNAVSVYNPQTGIFQGIAQGYGLAWTKQRLWIDNVIHGAQSGKILTWNYILYGTWTGNAISYSSLDNAQPWVLVKGGYSWVSATWDEGYTRWRIQGVVEDNDGLPTSIDTYDWGRDFAIFSGITGGFPVGYQDQVGTDTEIPLETRCGDLSMPNNFWCDTMRTSSGGTGGNPLTADTQLNIFGSSSLNVHD